MPYPRNVFKTSEHISKNLGLLVLSFFQYRNTTFEHTYISMLIPDLRLLHFSCFPLVFTLKILYFFQQPQAESPSSLLSKH